jgi:Protein phosphatase 2A regulatory B subunit (B56 family)
MPNNTFSNAERIFHYGRFFHPMFTAFVQVAERVLCFWNNDYITSLIQENASTVMAIMMPALLDISETHWNKQIALLIQSVLKLFHDINTKLYDELLIAYQVTLNK